MAALFVIPQIVPLIGIYLFVAVVAGQMLFLGGAARLGALVVSNPAWGWAVGLVALGVWLVSVVNDLTVEVAVVLVAVSSAQATQFVRTQVPAVSQAMLMGVFALSAVGAAGRTGALQFQQSEWEFSQIYFLPLQYGFPAALLMGGLGAVGSPRIGATPAAVGWALVAALAALSVCSYIRNPPEFRFTGFGSLFAPLALDPGAEASSTPSQTSPPPEAAQTPGGSGTAATRTIASPPELRPGQRAQVVNSPSPDSCLLLREYHTRRSSDPRSRILARLCNGERVTIQFDRVTDEGYLWWLVRTDSGMQGWASEGLAAGGERWLVPVQ